MTATFPDTYYRRVLKLLLSQFSEPEIEKDPEKVLNGTLELLSHFLNLNKGRVYLWDSYSMQLEIAYSHGLSPEQIHVGKYEISEGITGEAMSLGKAILVENVIDEPLYLGKLSSIVPEDKRSRSYIAVPIKHEGDDLGVLAVEFNSSNDGDMEANALVLQLVAEEFSKIIHRYELNEFGIYQAA